MIRLSDVERSLGSTPFEVEPDAVGVSMAVHAYDAFRRGGVEDALRGHEHRALITRAPAEDLVGHDICGFKAYVHRPACGASADLHVCLLVHLRDEWSSGFRFETLSVEPSVGISC